MQPERNNPPPGCFFLSLLRRVFIIERDWQIHNTA